MQNNYSDQIEKLYTDIESVKIQGATNVALATLHGMSIVAEAGGPDVLEQIESVGFKLSTARENEPLARNAVKYVLGKLKDSQSDDILTQAKDGILEFEQLIKSSKEDIKHHAAEVLKEFNVILTHCHSTTATGGIIEASKLNKDLKVVSTETRPLFQGRKTSRELLEAGVDVTQIVDSASASFIVDDRYLPVEAVVIGSDEVLPDGRVINKVGSYQMALAAKEGNDKLFVLASLLKIDVNKNDGEPLIEMRSAEEVWAEAPVGLKIINPSFELIPSELVSGYITEAGLLSASELMSKVKEVYPWI